MPLLTLLLALLFTVASVGTARIGAAIDARRTAWIQGRNGKSASPFTFRGRAGDIETGAASRSPAYTLSRLGIGGNAQAEFSVVRGVWDHRELLSDDGVHFGDLRKVVLEGDNSIRAMVDGALTQEGRSANFTEFLSQDSVINQLLGPQAFGGLLPPELQGLIEGTGKLDDLKSKFQKSLEEGRKIADQVIDVLEKKLKGDGKSSDPFSDFAKSLVKQIENVFNGDFEELGKAIKDLSPDKIRETIEDWKKVKDDFSS